MLLSLLNKINLLVYVNPCYYMQECQTSGGKESRLWVCLGNLQVTVEIIIII